MADQEDSGTEPRIRKTAAQCTATKFCTVLTPEDSAMGIGLPNTYTESNRVLGTACSRPQGDAGKRKLILGSGKSILSTPVQRARGEPSNVSSECGWSSRTHSLPSSLGSA